MELTEKGKGLIAAVKGAAKSGVSLLIPGLGPAIAGWDAYKRGVFEKNVNNLIGHLSEKIDNIHDFIRNKWFQTPEGEQFARKVVDSALDEQLLDKQEFFVNALINGTYDQKTSQLEKFKFIDMLRELSLVALMVLTDMHRMFVGQVRGPGRKPDPIQSFPRVKPEDIAEQLSPKYDNPYLIASAVREMTSQGLFSNIGDWSKQADGSSKAMGGFATELCYTDFAARFVEFIIYEGQAKLEKP